jgi:hypothetical protein
LVTALLENAHHDRLTLQLAATTIADEDRPRLPMSDHRPPGARNAIARVVVHQFLA